MDIKKNENKRKGGAACHSDKRRLLLHVFAYSCRPIKKFKKILEVDSKESVNLIKIFKKTYL